MIASNLHPAGNAPHGRPDPANGTSVKTSPETAAGVSHGLPSQCLTFQLGGELFAIDILCIKEIIEFRRLTVVPMMPDVVRGVINLRGAVVPVIDLHARFSHAPGEIGKRTCIVIVEVSDSHGARVVGLLVDAVNEVIDVDPADLAPPPAFGARVQAEFIRGIAKVDARFVIMLDVGQVFSLESLHDLPGDAAAPAS
jgi:purine-binding chemotaxis protein CheW